MCVYSSAIGFNVESVTYKNLKFQGMPNLNMCLRLCLTAIKFFLFFSVWDLGGQTSIRSVGLDVQCFPSWRVGVGGGVVTYTAKYGQGIG